MTQIIIGLVLGLLAGSIVMYFWSKSSSNDRVNEANMQVEAARHEAERLEAEAKTYAETARKTAVLEAKEEILVLKQEAEADEKAKELEKA